MLVRALVSSLEVMAVADLFFLGTILLPAFGATAIIGGLLRLRKIPHGECRLRPSSVALTRIGAGVAGALLGTWILMIVVEKVLDARDRTT
jgi:hypothetical protein